MQTIDGLIEFKGVEYLYTANVTDPVHDCRPDQVTDLDCADGSAVPDEVDFEALEELALENANLVAWYRNHDWQEEDTGGGCSALYRASKGVVTRITRVDDPSIPQTMFEPVIVGRYNFDDERLDENRLFRKGIVEWIQEGENGV
jgi:hypothetical protein